jgi:hypothetical protein
MNGSFGLGDRQSFIGKAEGQMLRDRPKATVSLEGRLVDHDTSQLADLVVRMLELSYIGRHPPVPVLGGHEELRRVGREVFGEPDLGGSRSSAAQPTPMKPSPRISIDPADLALADRGLEPVGQSPRRSSICTTMERMKGIEPSPAHR